ncbi:MAG: FAD-dependent oxidoreductase [bacterium]
MSLAKRVVIVGGNAAGMSAAVQARRLNQNLQIKVFEKGRYVSYASCGIPYFVGKVVNRIDRLVVRGVEDFKSKGIDVETRSQVKEIDLENRTILVESLDGGKARREAWDELVISTGAVPIRPNINGIDAEGVFVIKDLEDGIRIRDYLERTSPKRCVIVGGGYIGIEMAEAFLRWDLEITVVDMLPQVMGTMDSDMAREIEKAMRAEGIELVLGEKLVGFELNRGKVEAVVTENKEIPAELVLVAIGIRPNTKLAKSAQIPLGFKDAIAIDTHCRTRISGIWAAGDCAESIHLLTGKPTWIALGTVANKQGRVAGINIAGGDASFPGVVGTAITKFQELEIARTGLSERELVQSGIEFVFARIDGHTLAGYYPGSSIISVKLFAEKKTGRLVGGQIVGKQGSGKRIDVIATAIHAGMSVAELIDLDLSYAPPFSPTWDPVQIAARQLAKSV